MGSISIFEKELMGSRLIIGGQFLEEVHGKKYPERLIIICIYLQKNRWI